MRLVLRCYCDMNFRIKLLLSVIVGINNYRNTFPAAYYYISSKSAASFTFIANQLSDLAFANYLEVVVIIRDFFKGLKAACTAKAAVNFSLTKITDELLVCPLKRDKELLEAASVVVYRVLGMP